MEVRKYHYLCKSTKAHGNVKYRDGTNFTAADNFQDATGGKGSGPTIYLDLSSEGVRGLQSNYPGSNEYQLMADEIYTASTIDKEVAIPPNKRSTVTNVPREEANGTTYSNVVLKEMYDNGVTGNNVYYTPDATGKLPPIQYRLTYPNDMFEGPVYDNRIYTKDQYIEKLVEGEGTTSIPGAKVSKVAWKEYKKAKKEVKTR